MGPVTKRPKGFHKWNPRKATLDLLDQVNDIFAMYQDNLPLTARQVFYRLVGAYGYEKTELGYIRLCEALVRARRSGRIRFDYIRDDGIVSLGGIGHYDEEHWWKDTHYRASNATHNRTEGQARDVEVWCEAGGMLPQLLRVTSPYDILVYSTGGFSSVTATHSVAQRVCKRDRPTLFLHIGDLDPSGASIYDSMTEDIATFVSQYKGHRDLDWVNPGSGFHYERVALTKEQVEEFDLPTAPPKPSDSRTANWVGETCQAEAMPPDELAKILRDTIEEEIGLEEYNHILKREPGFRKRLTAQVEAAVDYFEEDVV